MITYKQYRQKHIKKNQNLLVLAKLHIKCTFKNTIINLTKNNGEVLKQLSTKSLKKTKFKKNTPYNVHLIVYKINKYIQLKKIKKLKIYLKGTGLGRYNILRNLRNLKNKKIKIISILDKTVTPFNGCKIKKMKRR